ncbi:calcium-binding protein [Jannaschia sp. 2305UL9-9]|uniref:calcium-binding protein n=1 Tax=Jannaschia sp. 2305UL9-9 TaxID=3121638 RepID=UPI0035272274
MTVGGTAITGMGTAQTGLGGPRGFGETELPRADDGSLRLDLSAVFGAGLSMFGQTHAAGDVFLNANGTLSFGSAFGAYPTDDPLPDRTLIAPFWADMDTRLDGEGAESGGVWLDVDAGADVVTITWDGVGAYRRDATVANTVQLQLFDRGGGNLDVVFRYQSIEWVQGTALDDTGARAGIAGPGGAGGWILPGDPAALHDLPDLTGSGGAAGLWVHEFRGGTLNDLGGGGTTGGGTAGNDTLQGGDFADRLDGLGGNDVLRGLGGDDTLNGGAGVDTLDGGAGDDVLLGGLSPADLRDVVFGGMGNDVIDGGAGNDELNGGAGHDTIQGGIGADTINGQDGDDFLSGASLGDLISGGPGDDFINGGFGFDRMNGGTGADRFYHLGVPDHGSDWIQDYSAAQGDVLAYGGTATAAQFQINWADTPRAGIDGFSEAFVIYRPTGQIVWALVDGATQGQILITSGGDVFDLLG